MVIAGIPFTMPAIWIGLIVIFLIVEGLTAGLVTIWFAVGALAALIAAMFHAPLWLQLVWFFAVSIAAFAVTRPLVKKYINSRTQPTNADMLIGQECLVTEDIDNLAGRGAVSVGGKVWTARAQTDAPINEVLAAGIIKLSGWHGQCNLVDPMCGSGTFLIEAALIAANINPGVYRNDFAFQRWSDYDPELYSKIYNDDSGEREFDYKIYGSDIAVQAVAIAEANVKSAGLGKMIEVRQQDLRELEEAPEKGYVITNPPYGERLRPDDIAGLYESIGQKLKKVFRGYQAWLITYDKELTSLIGLHPSVTYPLLNGDLECELREYVIFDGSYKDMKRAGGTLRNEGFRASDKDRGARRPFKETYGGDGDAESHDDGGKPRRRFDRDKKGRGERDGGKPRRFDRDKKGRVDRDDEQPRKPRRFDRNRDERDRRREQRREERHERHESLLDRDAFFHSDKFARQVLQHREPTLGKDAEVPIVRGRRKSWKRNDGSNENGNPSTAGDQ